MNFDLIRAELGGFDVECFDEIDSTNTYVKSIADGVSEGRIVIAKKQTAGRGRLGRSFFSPSASGLYVSILLRPALSPDKTVYITAAAAVAAAEVIEEVSCKATDIKWVNDIYIDGKKVCGILTEALFCGERISHAVLGVGINLSSPEGGFPDDIKDVAAGVFEIADDDVAARLLASFVERFFKYYGRLEEKEYLDVYRKKMLYMGERINVISPTEKYVATLVSVNDDFSLNVKADNGEERRIFSGEISIRKN